MDESINLAHRRWSNNDDERLLELYYQEPHLRVRDIAKMLQTTYGAVQARLHRLGAVRRQSYKYFKAHEIAYIRANIARKTYKEIARDLGRDPNSLRAIAYRYGIRRCCERYTYAFLAFVNKRLKEGDNWRQITDAANEHFDSDWSEQAVRQRWWYHEKRKPEGGKINDEGK